ncbi:MAG: hypothetical protein H6Q95_11 [Nitrospirae bacterium]|nr:hypothetical protein [Nitrospirota bacterium]
MISEMLLEEMVLEKVFGFIMILIGLISLVYAVNAKGKFPEESELKKITGKLIVVIICLTCFSFWHVLREVFHLKEQLGPVIEYPEYAFITIAFVMILMTAKHIYQTAKKFGITK